MARVKPILPSEIAEKKLADIPDAVIETFNQLIVENFANGSATVLQDAVVEELVSVGFNREVIFAKGLLNIENIYREAGWKVDYDKPGFNESYPATFKFTKFSQK